MVLLLLLVIVAIAISLIAGDTEKTVHKKEMTSMKRAIKNSDQGGPKISA